MIYGLAVHCKQTLSVFSEVGVSPPSFVTYTGCIAVSVCVQEKDREKEKKEGGRTTHCKIYTCRCMKGNPNLIENGLPVLLVCVCVFVGVTAHSGVYSPGGLHLPVGLLDPPLSSV